MCLLKTFESYALSWKERLFHDFTDLPIVIEKKNKKISTRWTMNILTKKVNTIWGKLLKRKSFGEPGCQNVLVKVQCQRWQSLNTSLSSIKQCRLWSCKFQHLLTFTTTQPSGWGQNHLIRWPPDSIVNEKRPTIHHSDCVRRKKATSLYKILMEDSPTGQSLMTYDASPRVTCYGDWWNPVFIKTPTCGLNLPTFTNSCCVLFFPTKTSP